MKVIVIGGGVIGLSCAWQMARMGTEVELFEARHCGEGATLAALGALWPPNPLAMGAAQRHHRLSLSVFETYVRLISEASGLPVRFARLGRLEIMDSAKAAVLARQEAAASTLQQVMEYLEPAQVAAVAPGVRAAPFGALRCHFTAQVMVHDLVAALHKACTRAGVAIHENTHVSGLVDGGVLVGTERFLADRVLVAGGTWTKLLPEFAALPLRPVKGQGLALRVGLNEMPFGIMKTGPIYLIPWHETGEVLVGSTTEPEAGFDERPTEAAREALLAGAGDLMPALRGAKVLRHWAGVRPQNAAKGHLPWMGPVPGREHVWICTGHYKTGIGMAPLVSLFMEKSIRQNKLSTMFAPYAPA